MSLANKLILSKVGFSLQSSASGNKILINRPYDPKNYIEASKNAEIFSKTLYHAFKENTAIKFCVLNLIHYLRNKNTLEIEDFEKQEIFFANDPINKWTITYPQGDGGIYPYNIVCLVLVVNNTQLNLTRILKAYFFHKTEYRKINFFIPIEYIQSLLFEE